jgi:hypothetical protein
MPGVRNAHRDRKAKFCAHAGADGAGNFGGRPEQMGAPATSANASSMDIRSTSGVKSPITFIAASPSR